MSLQLFGVPASSLVWTTRLLLAEKGVDYTLQMADCDSVFTMHQSPDIARHPYRKVPILVHEDRTLFETQAICRYIDRAFDGPRFTPDDAYAAGLNDQWMSVLSSYVDRAVIRELVLPSVIAKVKGEQPDKARLMAALDKSARALDPLEQGLEGQSFLLGDQPVLADFFLWPILFYLKRHPLGARLLRSYPRLRAVMETVSDRPSFRETLPV